LLCAIPLIGFLLRKPSYSSVSDPDWEQSRQVERTEFKASVLLIAVMIVRKRNLFTKGLSTMQMLFRLWMLLVCFWREVRRRRSGEDVKGRGGYLTPSDLGVPLIERLRLADVRIEVEVVRY
jgi:hypothetical protein